MAKKELTHEDRLMIAEGLSLYAVEVKKLMTKMARLGLVKDAEDFKLKYLTIASLQDKVRDDR